MDLPFTSAPELGDFLRGIPLFSELSGDEIAQLVKSARRVSVSRGTEVITEGAVGETLIVILSGQFEVSKTEDGRHTPLATRSVGDFLGEMALLEQRPRTATVRALSAGEILEIDASSFQQLLRSSVGVATTILRTIAGRLRSTESSLMQREKLASLGTLAAGLAHELNNPSAAIQRSGAQLDEALLGLHQRAIDLTRIGLSDAERRHLDELILRIKAPTGSRLLPRDVMAEEDRLITKLGDWGVDVPWDLAPGLAALGWTVADVDALAGEFDPARAKAAIEWVGTSVAAHQLVSEIQRSAKAISDIVRAVKSYSYLDQAEVQDVDVMMSLEDTLMILKHKLGEGITIVRNYADDLPRIEAYGSELNQVWTNLVDNAIDAMEGRGTLEVQASRFDEEVEVRIANTGPQIPEEAARRLFEPFFTTKPQGIGTGLGLHVSHNIVVNRHGGAIDFSSVAGRTEFRVRVPIHLRR